MKDEKQIWQKNRVELLRDYECGDEGLTSAEAGERAKKYGPNELATGPQKSTLRIFLEQFADFLVIILILAAIVSAVLGDVESTVVILAVITMNAVLGTVQTVKAAASLDSSARIRSLSFFSLISSSRRALLAFTADIGSTK